ncbi:hypothetical protein HY045_02485 [Candidatus Woesebacteria bacterium]|nr:hypothetical protein [Candidatus Woesebacteria bacterium]
MDKLVLIDGNAILHRAFHALPPLTTRNGEAVNAIYGLVSMLLKVIQDLKPTHLALVFDEKEKTFRQIEYPEYQANRPPMEEDLSSQFDKARKFLDAARIPIYSMPGYEADDVIGTISAGQTKVDEVIIVTGDRDILQLVNNKIKVFMPVLGLTNAKLFGPLEVAEKMGVGPEKIIDYKALVGDPSDNYPGVPGIGPKTAITLLIKYGNLDEIYNNLNEISVGFKDKLEKGKDSGYLSRKLATIVRNVPIDFDYKQCSKWQLDNQKVLNLFEEFGFRTLTDRIKKIGKQIEDEKQLKLL